MQADEAVEVLAWDRRGDLLAVGDLGGGVAVIDVSNPDVSTALAAHPGATTSLAWHPDRSLLATGGADGKVRLHTPGRLVATVAVGGVVRATCWSPGGGLLAVVAGCGVWIVDADGAHVAAAPLLAGAVHDAAWVDGGPAPLAVAGREGVAWFGPGIGTEPVETWEVTAAARVLVADPVRGRLATGDLAGVLRVASAASGDELAVSGWRERIERLAWHPTGRWLAVPDGDDVVVWHLDGVALVEDDPRRFAGHGDAVTDLAYAGTTLVTGSLDGTVGCWPDDPRAEPCFHDLDAPVTCVGVGAGRVAIGAEDGRVLLLARVS